MTEQEQKAFSKDELKQLDALRSYVPFLEVMSNMSPQQSETLLPYLKSTVHDPLCTCVSNSIFNFKNFDPDCKEKCANLIKSKLESYAFLSDKRKTGSSTLLKKRERHLHETSSGLPTLIGAVLPSLAKTLKRAADQKEAKRTKKRKQ